MNKSQLAWASYDFANSAFHLMLPTVLFPLYFKTVLLGGNSSSDMIWSLVISVPVLLVGLSSPFIGAYLDNKHKNRSFFIGVTALTIMLNFALGIVSPSRSVLNTVIYAVCLLCFNYSQFSYDAFLPTQKKGKGVASLSGWGWGTGYLGGIVCLIPVYFIISGKVLPEDYGAYQLAFIVTAAFYLIFTIPSFLFMKDDPMGTNASQAIKINPYKKVFRTLANWKENKHIFVFLIAFYLINDGLSTLVYFTSIFAATTLQMETTEILVSFLFVQLVGVPATIIFCNLSERLGYMKVFIATVVLWIILGIAFVIVSTTIQFYILAFFVGLVIGTTPAMARAIISSFLEDRSDSAEIFGFNALTSRASSILGPLTFGAVSTITGSQRLGLFSLVFFFGLGLILLIYNQKMEKKHLIYRHQRRNTTPR